MLVHMDITPKITVPPMYAISDLATASHHEQLYMCVYISI